jgi:hypothetical protein
VEGIYSEKPEELKKKCINNNNNEKNLLLPVDTTFGRISNQYRIIIVVVNLQILI